MFSKNSSLERHLCEWRQLRHTASCPEDVLTAFGNLSTKNRYIDYYTPESWPNPFEIIQHGMYDVTGISLLMYHTLVSLDFLDYTSVTWKVISNHITGHEGLIFQDEQGWHYNFLAGERASPVFVQQNSTEFFVHNIIVDPV